MDDRETLSLLESMYPYFSGEYSPGTPSPGERSRWVDGVNENYSKGPYPNDTIPGRTVTTDR